jgi:hypothetical protein
MFLSSFVNDMFKAATIVQQIMAKLSEAVLEKGKTVVITKIVLHEIKWTLTFIDRSKL